MFVNWLPLDAVIERNAAASRFVIDGGYDPDEDRRAVDAAVGAVADGRCDFVFVYLSASRCRRSRPRLGQR